ncbi:MAG: hypothetical protein ACYYKD_01150 [Rhodospirillales bacterium]
MTAQAMRRRRRIFGAGGAGVMSALALFLAGCAGADKNAEARADERPLQIQVETGTETGTEIRPETRAEPEPEAESAPETAAADLAAADLTADLASAAPGAAERPPERPEHTPNYMPEPEEPVFSVFAATPEWTEADLHGRTAADVKALLGAPDFERVDPPAAYWRYGGAACALDVFLYAESETMPRLVRHTDVRWTPGDVTGAECLNRLRRAHRAQHPEDGGETG